MSWANPACPLVLRPDWSAENVSGFDHIWSNCKLTGWLRKRWLVCDTHTGCGAGESVGTLCWRRLVPSSLGISSHTVRSARHRVQHTPPTIYIRQPATPLMLSTQDVTLPHVVKVTHSQSPRHQRIPLLLLWLSPAS